VGASETIREIFEFNFVSEEIMMDKIKRFVKGIN
jgi:hypothetical protein